MMNELSKNSISVAVIGSGYWGKNLVRNFHHLGALKIICDKNPARQNGWMCECGERLADNLNCLACGNQFRKKKNGLVPVMFENMHSNIPSGA